MTKALTIRKATVAELNAIVNRADVMPNLGGTAGVWRDIQEIEHWDRMLPLTAGDGAMLFLEVRPGMWRTDLLFIPRRRTNMEHARALMTYVFEEMDAHTIYGLTPRDNVMACRFVEKLPGDLIGQSEDGQSNVYSMRRNDWPWLTKPEQSLN